MSSPPPMSPISSPTSPTSPEHPPPPPPAAAAANASTSTGSTSTGTSTDKNATAPSMSEEEIAILLHRLSQKDTVTSVLILSRADGAIVRVTGALANPSPLNLDSSDGSGGKHEAVRGLVSEYAGVVWRFVRASEEMVVGELGRIGGVSAGSGGERGGSGREGERATGGGGDGDEVKLLRVRTRRGELVIVPEGRFILVVVHDTPGK